MENCTVCGQGKLQRRSIKEKLYKALGIPVLLVNAVMEEECGHCKHIIETIPYLDRLTAALALVRIKSRYKLRGEEVRFLRKALGLKATEFAKQLDVDVATVSRIENNKMPISANSERLLRFQVAVIMADKAPAIDIEIRDIMNLDITPFGHPEEPICLELITLKDAIKREKGKQWDETEKMVA